MSDTPDEKTRELAYKLLEERTEAFNKFMEEHVKALKQIKDLSARQMVEFDLFELLLGTVLARQPFLTVDASMRKYVTKASVMSLLASQKQLPGFDPGTDGRFLVVTHDAEEEELQKQELAERGKATDPLPEAYPTFGDTTKGEA